MNFKDDILTYELYYEGIFYKKIGDIPIIITAVHTINHKKTDGTKKKIEPFTKAIALYVANKTNSYNYVKIKDTGIDSNSDIEDDFKINLLKLIEKNNIKLLLDIHGASIEHDFDIELGTLDNTSAHNNTIKALKESFNKEGILKIEENNPFKGGGITKYINKNINIEVIQIEINAKYRNINESERIKQVCDALIDFIKKYNPKKD